MVLDTDDILRIDRTDLVRGRLNAVDAQLDRLVGKGLDRIADGIDHDARELEILEQGDTIVCRSGLLAGREQELAVHLLDERPTLDHDLAQFGSGGRHGYLAETRVGSDTERHADRLVTD